MATNANRDPEMLEPIRQMLETLAQDLTEQQFIPALREEVGRLSKSMEHLEASEETLSQIARGVDRLREVFAPAGTRLLESAKDLETVMRANSDLIKDRTGDVLNDLLRTHEQLEGALRGEAGLLKEQASASREALTRTVAEVEARLANMTTQVDGLCRRLENDADSLRASLPAGESAAVAMPAVTVQAEFPAELKDLIGRTEQVIQRELESYREELGSALKQGRSDDSERLYRLDQKVAEALNTIGPRVQEELESAVSRLRDQIQTLILAEVETRTLRPAEPGESAAAAVPSADMTAALTASETRILREISTLQKSQRGDQSEGERLLKTLAQGFEEAAQHYSERVTEETQAIKDSLAAVQRLVAPLRDSEREHRDQAALLQASLDALVKNHRDFQHTTEEEFRTALNRMEAQTRMLDAKAEEDRQLFSQLAASISRSEQAATTAMELATTESRAQRERIEAGIKDLRERLERGQSSEGERMQETLRRVAEAWTEALEALRDFVQKTISNRTDSILTRLESIETRLTEGGGGGTTRETQGELKRVGGLLDERMAALGAHQDASLQTLKDAIKANYDENAARLKEVIESAFDNFVKQTASVPQALDRYSHLIQSLYQGDQLALQGISSDTRNLVALSTDRFDTILADNTAMKKFFPLLDKKLEKQGSELEMVRKAQVRQDKENAEMRSALTQARDAQEEQGKDLRNEVLHFEDSVEEKFTTLRDDVADLRNNIVGIKEDHLPAFRRELNALLTSKFEFIEKTLHERQETLSQDVAERLARDKQESKKTLMLILGAAGLSILLQLVFHFMRTPGAGH